MDEYKNNYAEWKKLDFFKKIIYTTWFNLYKTLANAN